MAHTLEQLTRQENTLTSIRGVVRTMKALAALNAPPYERAATAIEAYRRTVRHGFAAFAHRMGGRVVVDEVSTQRQVLVAFGSDHGFCGNYNEAVARLTQKALADSTTRSPVVLCVGAKLEAALADSGVMVEQRLTPPASVDGIGRLASQIVSHIERLAQGLPLISLHVNLVHTCRLDRGERGVVVTPLLPLERDLLEAPRPWPERALPDFSMAPKALLAALLRNHIFANVFHASAEAMATENAARLALMQQAEQSVDERLEAVRRHASRVRQDQVTEELMDIVIGHFDAVPSAPRIGDKAEGQAPHRPETALPAATVLTSNRDPSHM
jgi:F-type H+-transporting ATPase subunit gamma